MKSRLHNLLDRGERLIPRENEPWELADHLSRYIFVQNFLNRGERILEVGCGVGYGLRKLSNAVPTTSIGIDVSREAVLFAKKSGSFQNCLEFAVMDGSNLGFRDNTFDAVFSLEVVEHVMDYQKFIQESSRVLKLGGTYVISTPNRNYSRRFIQCPFHTREFTRDELLLILNILFKEVQIYGKKVKSSRFLMEQERLSRKTKSQFLRFGLRYFPFARFLTKHLPRYIKKRVTGYPQINLTLNDFEIVSEIENASNLVGVAKKL